MTEPVEVDAPPPDFETPEAAELRRILGVLTQEELCRAIGVSLYTLAEWRRLGIGPSFTRLGRRVFYRVLDLRTWTEENINAAKGNPPEISP